MDEQNITNTETANNVEKAKKPLNKKQLLIRIGCVVLAIVAVGLSCYFIFREKYGITPEIRVSFPGGECRNGDWYIPYDGEEHTPNVSFWDGNTRVNYRHSFYDEGSYGYYFEDRGVHYESVKERGNYTLLIEAGPTHKNGKTKYIGQQKWFTVIVY